MHRRANSASHVFSLNFGSLATVFVSSQFNKVIFRELAPGLQDGYSFEFLGP